MSENITQSDFFKSLERLEALANGSEDLEKSQICTGSGNEPQTWPGGDKSELGDNWTDNIKPDGTDYTGPGSKARKSIAEKIYKGEALSEAEVAILKGDYVGDDVNKAKRDKEEDEEEEERRGPPAEDDEDEMPEFARKSVGEVMQENETIQKGIEVSDFLSEFANAMALGMVGMEQRITKSVTETVLGGLQEVYDDQGEFNKSLAEAVANIGHGMAGLVEFQGEAQEMPAGPPRSQLRSVPGGQQQQQPQVLNKGVGGDGLENMSKSQMLDRMSDLVTKGQMNPLDVIKFESTNELTPQVQDSLAKSFASGQ